MSASLAHPFRVDSNGRAVTVEQGSARHAAETCGHIVACEAGERALAPLLGLIDPSGTTVTPDEVTATVVYGEPALDVVRCEIRQATDGTVAVDIDVAWATTDDEEG